jgi:hypothetical protein
MFKKFTEMVRGQNQPINLTEKNRQRFDSIISDTRFDFLEDVYKRLLADDTTLTDQQILDNYFRFSDNIQTNTIAAAELEWVTISVLCFYRPNLTEELIRRGLLSIVYSWGDSIDNEHVLDFIQERILAVNAEPYGGLPPDVGMRWLTDILPAQQNTIQRVLEDVVRQNRLEVEQL